MNIHLQKKAPFKVLGYKEHFPIVEGKENFEEIAAMWQTLTSEKMAKLLSLADGQINGFIGVSDEQGQADFNYLIGITSTADQQEEMEMITFPEADWLVFKCTGPIPTAMMTLKKEILYDWLPNSKYEQLSLPRFEIYFQGDMSATSYQSELWIPVR